MRCRFVGIAQNAALLPRQMLTDQLPHSVIGNPVAGSDDGWLEAARYLVLATGTGLEGGQAFAQAVGNALIKAEFEVQAMVCLLYTSPNPRDRTRSRMPSSA
mgnify:CR=1 FL=1